jgi:putative ABC transport system ATP-binding protein
MRLLHELNERGSTLLVVTHDREIADSLPRQVEIRDGLIVRDESGRTEASRRAATAR